MLIAQRVLCSYFYYLFCSLSSNAQIILPSLLKSNEIFHLNFSFLFRTFFLHLRETISSSLAHFLLPKFSFFYFAFQSQFFHQTLPIFFFVFILYFIFDYNLSKFNFFCVYFIWVFIYRTFIFFFK